MAPLEDTLQSLTVLNLHSKPHAGQTYDLKMFTQLKELTISASELFQNIRPGFVQSHCKAWLSPSLEKLNLYVQWFDHNLHFCGGARDLRKTMDALLRNPFPIRHSMPNIKLIVWYIACKRSVSLPEMLQVHAVCGVEVKVATMQEVTALREKLRITQPMT
jgi:hypothetical protein